MDRLHQHDVRRGGVTPGDWTAVAAGALVATAMWVFMFRRPREGIWPRTWIAAGVLSAYAVAATGIHHLLGPISASEFLLGVAVGGVWLAVTHAGAFIIGRLVPPFFDEVADLYRLAERSSWRSVAGPLIAMAVAEELMFRGVVQGRAGLAAAIVVYGAVQLVERKAALVLAGLLSGAVWGTLTLWRHGLVAAIVAHAVWTLTLALIWPIPGRRVSGLNAHPR